MEKLTLKTLDGLRDEKQQTADSWIKVGMSTCGIAAGADVVYETLMKEVDKHDIDVQVEMCGCAGMCFAEPLVEVSIKGMPSVIYGEVDKATAKNIVNKHVLGKYLLNDHIFNVKVK